MVATLDWSDIDPLSGGQGVVHNAPREAHNIQPATPFFSPEHELFGFGVLVGLTALALYVATEGAGVGFRARFGQAHASADAGLEGEK